MEDNNRNLILATVLSFLVILVWYTVFAPEPVSDQPSGQPLMEQVVGDQPLATPGTGAATTAPADLAAELPGFRATIRITRTELEEMLQQPLAGVLTALSALAAELPEVAEIDLNPVIVSAAGPRVADALVVRSPAP